MISFYKEMSIFWQLGIQFLIMNFEEGRVKQASMQITMKN